MQRNVIGLLIALVVWTTGCSGFQELSIEQRNRNAAYCAWKRVRWEYQQQGVPYRIREHLGRGFQQGYYDVSMGGNGQVPLFPPNVYWGVKYQNEEGSAAIGAWFRGYQDGAIAAEKDGLATFNQIPSSWAPPPQPGSSNGALTRDEFDGDQEIVPAVPSIPPASGSPFNVPMQPPPSELPPLLQPNTPPAVPLPVLPLPTTPNSTLPAPTTTPAPSLPTTPNPNSTTPPPATPAPTGSKTTAVPPAGTATGSPALTAPNPMPSATGLGTTGPAATIPARPMPSATGAPPAPSATPSPTLPRRDPIGGRTTQYTPEAAPTPAAQLMLFGAPAESGPAIEVLR